MFENLSPQQAMYLMPVIIFGLKIIEVSISSVRYICTAKGYRNISFFLSIFECGIWIVNLSTVFTHLEHTINMVAYTLGMAMGIYIGITIENKLQLGDVLVRIIAQKDAKKLLLHLRKTGFRVTEVPAESNHGAVSILFSPIKTKNLKEFIKIVKNFNPHAFYTIEEIKQASKKIGKENLQQEVLKHTPVANIGIK